MGQTLAAKDQWYVVHVLSGQENKVRENIVKRVKTEEMGDMVYDVLLPTERVSEIKKGKKTETTRKFFPGYLIVNMHLLDENNQLVGRTWYFIRNTPGVIGFAGTKDKPIPMRQSEVESMLAQMKEREEKVKPKVSFEVGESREGRRRSVPKSDRYRRRDRSRAWQAACFRHHFRSRHAGGTGILAGRTRIIINRRHSERSQESLDLNETNNGQRNNRTHQTPNSRRTSQPCAAGGYRAGSTRRQHHGVLQGI